MDRPLPRPPALRPLPLPKNINVDAFKNAGEGYLVVSPDGLVQAVPNLGLAADLQGRYINPGAYKAVFINSLAIAGGPEIAQQALIQVGLANYASDDNIFLHSDHVKSITKAAAECWDKRRAANNKTDSFAGGDNFTQPVTAHQNPNLAKFIPAEARPEKLCNTRTADSRGTITQFKRTFPYLASFESLENCRDIEEVGQFLDHVWQQGSRPSTTMPLLYHADRKYLTQAIAVVKAIRDIQDLFSLMAVTPEHWNKIIQALDVKINILSGCLELLLAYSLATSKEAGKERAFHHCLLEELKHQTDLLIRKKVFITSMRDRDPFSEQRVAYNNFIWSKVIMLLFNDAQHYCSATPAKRRLVNNFTTRRELIEQFVKRKNESALTRSERRVALPKVIPGLVSQDKHPVNLGKKECVDFLSYHLSKAGLSQEEIETQFTKEKILLNALRRVLNSQKPPTDNQTIVASIDGVTDWFTMETIYVEGWVSSAETQADGIPRNCKIHRLTDSQGQSLITAVGHGVLDMWGIPDKEARAASNAKAADKVVSLAAENNPRVVQLCNQGGTPEITHVSALLITPTGLTQNPVIKKKTVNYHEEDYKTAQLASFKAVNDKRTILVNGRQVTVEVIAFVFGINKLATGERNSKVTGGWKNVKKHNQRSMERFIGELNKAKLHVKDQRPGGFIGHVMDLVDGSGLQPEEKREHLTRLQRHTDIVRDLFLSKDYKKSDGDPAKMPREIIVLQAYAEKALAAIKSKEAATISKGCKSDKDRGGVVISEVFHELIIEDLGGSVAPNEILDDEKKAIYLGVAATQFEVQTASTALPGNKAIGRDIGKEEQVFLTGLSPFAKE